MYQDGRLRRSVHLIEHLLARTLLMIFLGFAPGCSSRAVLEAPADAARTMQDLKLQLVQNPNDEPVLRELGILYFQTGDHRSAIALLDRAYSLNPSSADTRFFLALALEQLEQIDRAIDLYATYPDIPRNHEYRSLMEGRYHWLVNQRIKSEMQQRLADESTVSLSAAKTDLIAVFPLSYSGADPKLRPLGRGIAELLMVDFGHIERLRIVERVRLQEVMAELRLSNGENFNQASAPRIGKLLKAGTLIHGNYRDLDANNLRIDLAAWDIRRSDIPDAASETDRLENLFKVEKDLVFRTLDELNIEPTPEERKRIEYIPTTNLQAFLRYSLALELQDQQKLEEAAREFDAASKLDPGFSAARTASEKVRSLRQSGMPLSQMLNRYPQLRKMPAFREMAGKALLKRRLGRLNRNLGSGFRAGREKRKAAIEADRSGEGLAPSTNPGTSGG